MVVTVILDSKSDIYKTGTQSEKILKRLYRENHMGCHWLTRVDTHWPLHDTLISGSGCARANRMTATLSNPLSSKLKELPSVA